MTARRNRKATTSKPHKSPPGGGGGSASSGSKGSSKKKPRKEEEEEEEEERIIDAYDDSSSDGSSDEDESPTAAPPLKKAAKKASKESSSSESDGSSSEEDDDEDEDDDEKEHGAVFSDKNASWLKPKKTGTAENKKSQLLSSDDDDESEEEEEEDLLDIEREAREVDEEMEEERIDAEEELRRTIREQTSVYHLPTEEELERDNNGADRVVPPSEVRSHIDSILEVLADFKERREPDRSRKEYIDVLSIFIAELYGYLPELVEYFLTMFGPTETLEFIDQSDKPRPMVIRTNTLKARRKDLAAALIKRGVTLDPLAAWSKVGLKIIESPVPVGATPEYLSGLYMLQSAASMCPVLALGPLPKERVLDVSAAPGGKTSYIAQLMRNTGVIFANDIKAERQKATVANMHRLGVKNVIACKHDGRKMGTLFKNRFDRILLDAPCSGLGVISRDPSVKVQRTLADVNQCAHLQKELILAAIDALKFKGTTGGVMVYSTCSVSIAENEEVVNYALSKRDIRIVDAGLDFGKPGFTRFQQKRFHPSVALTRRFYPHVHNMDGFFVAKIQKLSDRRPGEETSAATSEEGQAQAEKTETKKEEVKNKPSAKKKKSGKRPKRKRDEDDQQKQPTKNRNVSVPPKKPKQSSKKQTRNAKTTKPRRKRAATDA